MTSNTDESSNSQKNKEIISLWKRLNKDGLVPLSLAAKLSNWEMFSFLMEERKITIASFGSFSKILYPLDALDREISNEVIYSFPLRVEQISLFLHFCSERKYKSQCTRINYTKCRCKTYKSSGISQNIESKMGVLGTAYHFATFNDCSCLSNNIPFYYYPRSNTNRDGKISKSFLPHISVDIVDENKFTSKLKIECYDLARRMINSNLEKILSGFYRFVFVNVYSSLSFSVSLMHR